MISKLSLSGAARTLKIKQCMTRTKHTQYPLIPTSSEEESVMRDHYHKRTLSALMSYELKLIGL